MTQKLEKGPFWTINLGHLINLASLVVAAGYYIGVHKSEMQTIQSTIIRIEDKIVDFQKEVDKLKSFETITAQKDIRFDGNVTSLDIRVTRLEDAIPKIALLNKDVQMIAESQKEMKETFKEFSKDIKSLAEKIK